VEKRRRLGEAAYPSLEKWCKSARGKRWATKRLHHPSALSARLGAMELSGSVREMTREQPLLQSEDAGEQKMDFSHFEMFPGFGKDRKKDLQQKDWMMCHVLSSKQKFRKFKSMLNRILIQISNSKKTCHPLSVAAALSIYFVGGKMLGCFLFSRFVTQKRWAYISQRCLRRLFEGSDG